MPQSRCVYMVWVWVWVCMCVWVWVCMCMCVCMARACTGDTVQTQPAALLSVCGVDVLL